MPSPADYAEKRLTSLLTKSEPKPEPAYRGGPKTPEGKQRSSLNALRHGLTGCLIVLPGEDMDAYQKFAREYTDCLHPATPVERQFAQTAADNQWRINRIKSIEDGMLGLGQSENISHLDTGHPEVDNVLASAQTFRDNSRAFVNLSIYEQRLSRAIREALRQLEELQTKREAKRKVEMDDAIRLKKLDEMEHRPHNPAAGQFVYSSAEITREEHLRNRREDALCAEKVDFDRIIYYQRFYETTPPPFPKGQKEAA